MFPIENNVLTIRICYHTKRGNFVCRTWQSVCATILSSLLTSHELELCHCMGYTWLSHDWFSYNTMFNIDMKRMLASFAEFIFLLLRSWTLTKHCLNITIIIACPYNSIRLRYNIFCQTSAHNYVLKLNYKGV